MSPTLGTDLLGLLPPAPPRAWEPVATEHLDLVGAWFWGPTPLVIRATPAGLTLSPMGTSGRASRFAATEGGWQGLDGYYADEPLRVVRARDGRISHLDLASFILTREPYSGDDVPGGVDPGGWR